LSQFQRDQAHVPFPKRDAWFAGIWRLSGLMLG
jgi:hypothetical protein